VFAQNMTVLETRTAITSAMALDSTLTSRVVVDRLKIDLRVSCAVKKRLYYLM